MTSQSPIRRVLAVLAPLLGCLAVLLIARWQADRGVLLDFYPLYHGATNLLEYGDAYRQDPPEPTGLGRIGNPYPLHAVLVAGVPFAPLPPVAAGILYTIVVGLAWIAAIRYARQSWAWLLWWPMWDAIRIQQASALVTVAIMGAVGASQRGHRAAFLVAMVLASIKPQQTLALLLLLAWAQRRWWREMLFTGAVIIGLTFILEPSWVQRWIERVQLRSELVGGELWLGFVLIPLAVLGYRRGWHLSAAAVLSTGLAPWPITGQYVASIWPIGMPWQRIVLMTLGSTIGLQLTILTDNYWPLPAAMMLATAIAWLPTLGESEIKHPDDPPGSSHDQRSSGKRALR